MGQGRPGVLHHHGARMGWYTISVRYRGGLEYRITTAQGGTDVLSRYGTRVARCTASARCTSGLMHHFGKIHGRPHLGGTNAGGGTRDM